jgi:hypothetical protein
MDYIAPHLPAIDVIGSLKETCELPAALYHAPVPASDMRRSRVLDGILSAVEMISPF